MILGLMKQISLGDDVEDKDDHDDDDDEKCIQMLVKFCMMTKILSVTFFLILD